MRLLLPCHLVAAVFLPLDVWCADRSSIESARDALSEWRSKFISIHVRSSTSSVAESNALLRDAKIQTGITDHDWIWEDSGRFYDYGITRNDGRIVTQSLRSADRKQSYSCTFPSTDPGRRFPSKVAISENSLKHTGVGIHQQPFFALWDDASRTWLDERLVATVEVSVDRNGRMELQGEAIGMQGCVVRLDPEHGYLPCDVHFRDRADIHYLVDDFREFYPGFWFPSRGRILTVVEGDHLDQAWEIHSVELNPELPETASIPLMGDETYVLDNLAGRQYWYGGKPPRNVASTSTREPVAMTEADGDSRIPNVGRRWSIHWNVCLVFIGLSCVAIGVWARRRS